MGVVVVDEAADTVFQIGERGERTVTRELATQHAEPDFDLIQPAAIS